MPIGEKSLCTRRVPGWRAQIVLKLKRIYPVINRGTSGRRQSLKGGTPFNKEGKWRCTSISSVAESLNNHTRKIGRKEGKIKVGRGRTYLARRGGRKRG